MVGRDVSGGALHQRKGFIGRSCYEAMITTTKTVVKKGGGGGSIWRKRRHWKSKVSIVSSTVFIGKLELLAWIDGTVGRMIRLVLHWICTGMVMDLVWIIELLGVT